MKEEKAIPSLVDWIGGVKKIENLIVHFYDKVMKDDLLSPIFLHMSSQHQIHVAHFISEVFGGEPLYTQNGGSHFGMIKKHLGKHLTEAHRKQWVFLLLESADELGLPDDPEFRSAFVGYLEWGSRLAVMNSHETEIAMDKDEPMPKWGWGEVGGPFVE